MKLSSPQHIVRFLLGLAIFLSSPLSLAQMTCARALAPKVSQKEAALLAEEFMEKGAIFNTLQFAAVLMAGSQEGLLFRTKGTLRELLEWAGSQARDSRNNGKYQEIAKSFAGSSEADRNESEQFHAKSVLILERLLEIPASGASELYLDSLRKLVIPTVSQKAMLETLKYIIELKQNEPQKYAAFIESWRASTPLALSIATKSIRYNYAGVDRWSKEAAITGVATSILLTVLSSASGVHTGGEDGFLITFFSGVAGALFSGIPSILSNDTHTPTTFLWSRGLSAIGILQKAMVKKRVKELARQTLALPAPEAQKLIALPSGGQRKLLDQIQDLDRAALQKLLLQDGFQTQVSDLTSPHEMQLVAIRQMRVMEGLINQTSLLQERRESIEEQFDDLVARLRDLTNASEQDRRTAMREANEIQLGLTSTHWDGEELRKMVDAYLSSLEKLQENMRKASALTSPGLHRQIEGFVQNTSTQITVINGMKQSIVINQGQLQQRIDSLPQVNLGIMALQLQTNSSPDSRNRH